MDDFSRHRSGCIIIHGHRQSKASRSCNWSSLPLDVTLDHQHLRPNQMRRWAHLRSPFGHNLPSPYARTHSHLSFSEDSKTMTRMETAQPYPDSPERFADWGQVLCKEGLSARCYWEVEWTGEWTGIGVAYKGISRKAKGNDSVLGYNDQSWSLRYHQGKYNAWYNKNDAAITVPYFNSKRTGVFLDWSAGTLSFYAISSNTMTHLHTFHTQFSEPVYPGFRLGFEDSSLTLCPFLAGLSSDS
uniref:B30.2/SPRY domain-containing protein n=1 Tax=Seriola lalandi dorsalis TaxID=1841481 RepID=A0A3B4WJW2_SERLL